MTRSMEAAALKRHRGASLLGILLSLLVLGFLLMVGLKIVPVYIDHNVLKGVAESLVESGRAADMSQSQIRQEMGNSLRINNIHDFDLSAITSSRTNNVTRIFVSYEKRVHLFYNIDAVLTFDETIEQQ